MYLGGQAAAEKITDVMLKWFSTGLCFRPYWSETSQFGLVTVDHRFHGTDSPGFPSDAPPVFFRGDVHEIGVSFEDSDDVGNLVSRVNLKALPGLDADGKTFKFFQTIPVEDVSQTSAGSESYDMAYSEAVLT